MRLPLFLLAALFTTPTLAAEFFISPDGNDSNPGTQSHPFATLSRAQNAISPGDTVTLRAGTYAPTTIMSTERIFARVIDLSKSGTQDHPITYRAADGERVLFDLSNVKPEGKRVTAFYVRASYLRLTGLEVTGVQVTITTHTQSICFENAGDHNVFERCSMHDGMAIGFYMTRGSNNLVLNCDAYRNYDPVSESGKGGNVDGFGCHPRKGDTGNVIRGCRAWFNSDDGYDCINAAEPVTFENCWAFYNGYSAGDFKKLADGNGFKSGGYGATPVDRLPDPIPRHLVRNCLSVHNKASGFYANHHPAGLTFENNTAYANAAQFNLLGRLPDNRTDVDGGGHVLKNNMAAGKGAALVHMDLAKCEVAGNSWSLKVDVTDADFISTDEKQLTRERRANGDLPEIDFLKLRPGRLTGMGASF